MSVGLSDVFACGALVFAVMLLRDLRYPYPRRARWGKGGIGAPMSAFSITVVAGWLVALAVAMAAHHVVDRVPPTLEIDVVFSGFVAGIVCGVIDSVIHDRSKKKA